jgi:hypothetical protein
VALGRKRLPVEAKGNQMDDRDIAANELQGISAAAFCHDALSRPPVEPTS